MLPAGSLRDRITILEQGGGQDEANQPLPDDWVEYVKLWANVRFPNGLEAIRADSPASIVKVSVRIRWRTDIKHGMRVQHRDKVYDIEAILPDAKRVYVDLACRWVT